MKTAINIFHYFDTYKRHWLIMVLLIAVVASITAVVEYKKPITYRSTIVVLSSKDAGGGDIGSYFGIPNLVKGSSSDDIIFAILKSRRMKKDIREEFNLKDKLEFWWKLETYELRGGFAVEVEGPDPQMTKEIANFSVKNLDEINLDIGLTSQKPMVKVLDEAEEGSPIGRNISKRTIASGLFVFLFYALFLFFREYFFGLKKATV